MNVQSKPERPALTLGLMPLVDAAPLIVAQAGGYFAREGLAIELVVERSWASIRDKLATGVLDGAQMLATMPLAASLGLDPLYIANEGRFVAFVAPDDVVRTLEVLRRVEVSQGAAMAGYVDDAYPSVVTLRSRIGDSRVLDLLSGEQLPRLC